MEQIIDSICTKTGISKDQAESVVEWIKEHISELPGMLSGGGLGDLAEKAKDMIPGLGG